MGKPVMAGGEKQLLRFVYDVETHGGGQTFRTIGTLPLNFIPCHTHIVCVVPLVGSGASIAVGNADTGNAFLAATAITTMDTALKHQDAIINDIAAATTTNLRNIGVTPSTADLTAGSIEVYIEGFVPVNDQTTLVGA